MNTTPATDLNEIARDCVWSMGDIFWDFKPARDVPLEFHDPYEIAIETVEQTLRKFVAGIESSENGLIALRAEYAAIVADLPVSPNNAAVVRALVEKADWTEDGAREVLQLAQRYGTSILRNALALAEAMDIEDGNAGL